MRFIFTLFILLSTLLANGNVTNSQYALMKEEELKLMLNSFLYANDTKSAFKVARIGYKKYHSLYWLKQASKTAQWSGHYKESVKYEILIYNQTKDPQLRDKIINYSLSVYQYLAIENLTIKRAIEKPSDKNIDFLIYIENMIGTPEKAAEILHHEYIKNPDKTSFLTKELQIYLDAGSLNNARQTIDIIDKKKLYNLENVILITYYYYIEKNITKAYSTLSKIDPSTTIKNNKYYQLKSDLGWYLEDYATAANASMYLINTKDSRLADYLRVIEYYRNKKPSIAVETADRAYNKYKLSYIFYLYALNSIENKRYLNLQETIQKIDKNGDKIIDEAHYWIIKAKISIHFKHMHTAEKELNKASVLADQNMQQQIDILWLYMQYGMQKSIKEFLLRYEDMNRVDPNLYFPFASAYFELNDIDRSDYYLQKIDQSNKSIEIKFLQAYVYQSQNNEDAYLRKLREILSDLRASVKNNSRLEETNTYWSNYLNASMPLIDSDTFSSLLKKAKQFLSAEDYTDIEYSFATKNRAYEKSHEIYRKAFLKKLRMHFNDVMIFNNHTQIENILARHLKDISQIDAVEAASNDHQISLAQTVNYNYFDHNRYSQNAYTNQLDLAQKRSNKFIATLSYQNRDPLLQHNLALDNSIYLYNGYTFDTAFNYFNNNSLNETTLNHIKTDTYNAQIGIEKEFTRLNITTHLGYRSYIKDYINYGLDFTYDLSEHFQTTWKFEKNMGALDSIALETGGKKDMISANLNVSILNSLSLEALYEKNIFSSQDNIKVASQNYFRFAINKQIRNGYPDIAVSLFADKGVYNSTAQNHGLLDSLQNDTFAVPQDFYNIGGEFRYGMVNSNIYTRVWRPFFSFSTYYNNISNNMNIRMDLGYGGKIFFQDHCVVGGTYSQNANNSKDTILEIYLKYQFLYTK